MHTIKDRRIRTPRSNPIQYHPEKMCARGDIHGGPQRPRTTVSEEKRQAVTGKQGTPHLLLDSSSATCAKLLGRPAEALRRKSGSSLSAKWASASARGPYRNALAPGGKDSQAPYRRRRRNIYEACPCRNRTICEVLVLSRHKWRLE